MPKIRRQNNQSGFTLIELLVVIGILAILLAITIIAINPIKHFQDARNNQRQSDTLSILDGINEYLATHGGVLSSTMNSISTTAGSPSAITSTAGGSNVNLCSDLAPTYVADIPVDPTSGTRGGATSCVGTYSSGYTISRNSTSNRFTVNAPSAEGGATISVTR